MPREQVGKIPILTHTDILPGTHKQSDMNNNKSSLGSHRCWILPFNLKDKFTQIFLQSFLLIHCV